MQLLMAQSHELFLATLMTTATNILLPLSIIIYQLSTFSYLSFILNLSV